MSDTGASLYHKSYRSMSKEIKDYLYTAGLIVHKLKEHGSAEMCLQSGAF